MLTRSFFLNFGQGPFPKIAGKSPVCTQVEIILLTKKRADIKDNIFAVFIAGN